MKSEQALRQNTASLIYFPTSRKRTGINGLLNFRPNMAYIVKIIAAVVTHEINNDVKQIFQTRRLGYAENR